MLIVKCSLGTTGGEFQGFQYWNYRREISIMRLDITL